MAVGLASRGRLRAMVLTRYRAVEYRTLLYLVRWDDGARDAAALGPRLAQPEVAVM